MALLNCCGGGGARKDQRMQKTIAALELPTLEVNRSLFGINCVHRTCVPDNTTNSMMGVVGDEGAKEKLCLFPHHLVSPRRPKFTEWRTMVCGEFVERGGEVVLCFLWSENRSTESALRLYARTACKDRAGHISAIMMGQKFLRASLLSANQTNSYVHVQCICEPLSEFIFSRQKGLNRACSITSEFHYISPTYSEDDWNLSNAAL